MRIASSVVMRAIDKYCIDSLRIPSLLLMENAALKVIKNIDMEEHHFFAVVCGKGNNGGDGFAIARHLFVNGKHVEVFLIGSEEGMSFDCRANYTILKNMGIKVEKINNVEDMIGLREALERSQVTIDSIFGTGLSKQVEGIYDSVISIINENSKYIIAIDVPSGFDSDSGRVLGNCIKANKTISFQLYKRGFLNYGTDKLTGEIVIEEIGIPKFVIDKFHENQFIMDGEMVRGNLVERDKYGHKGDYGRVVIFAGSKEFSGAPYIATQAAVRSGAGLVTLCCPEEIRQTMSSKLVEAMTITFDEGDRLEELIEKSSAIAVGPGMGDNDGTLNVLKYVISKAKCPVVIDADGINVLKNNLHLLKGSTCQLILTPHLGEMARITGITIEEVRENRLRITKDFAEEYGVILLLKGYNTVVSDGNITVVNSTGNSSMASGGMGDCLTGMITAFLAQGYKPLEAACIATYIHGYCGEKLSKEMFCVNASHILEDIPKSIKECGDFRV